MSYGNRRVTHSNNNNTSVRTVSYNAGGLNERFSKIVKTAASKNTTNKSVIKSNGPGSSVFSRLRGAKNTPERGQAGNIQSRLGKTVGGGIKKKTNTTQKTVKAVVKQQGTKNPTRHNKQPLTKANSKKQATEGGKKAAKPIQKKPMTAEDLDKALDAYMMKDPKTAQAKLDAELTSYMDEAQDLLMEESI